MDANFPELAATGKKDDEKTYKFTGCKRKTPGDTGGANSSSGCTPPFWCAHVATANPGKAPLKKRMRMQKGAPSTLIRLSHKAVGGQALWGKEHHRCLTVSDSQSPPVNIQPTNLPTSFKSSRVDLTKKIR